MKPSYVAKRIARRAYADRMAERQFVREVLARKADFLDPFRRQPAAAVVA
jgi:hypothetical protein